VAFAIPVEPRANWAIRIAEPADRRAAMAGVRAALALGGVAPAVLFAAVSAGLLWEPRAAMLHVFVCAVMGMLLVDILLINLPKLPFTCTYYPGKAKFGRLWPLYLTAFGTYAFTTARFELEVLNQSMLRPFVILSVLVAAAIALLSVLRNRSLESLQGFRFEEEDPDSIFRGFELSEGFAARSRTET
jgi:hypothetical protein